MSAPVMSMFATQEECHKARAAYFQQKCLEEEAKVAACERQVNEMAEINKELLDALISLHTRLTACMQDPFSVAEAYDSFYQDLVVGAIAKYEEF